VHISQGDTQRVIELGSSILVSEFLPRLGSNAVFKDAFLLCNGMSGMSSCRSGASTWLCTS